MEYNVCCEFFIYDFYYVEVISFYSSFLKCFVFYHDKVLNVIKCFSYSDRDGHVFFLQSVNVVNYID